MSACSALLSQAAAMIQEVAGVDAMVGAAFVGLLSVANALGQPLWTGLSDLVGRRAVLLAMFVLQTRAVVLLRGAPTWTAFALLGILVLLFYGGSFGMMATVAANYFGPTHVGLIYSTQVRSLSQLLLRQVRCKSLAAE